MSEGVISKIEEILNKPKKSETLTVPCSEISGVEYNLSLEKRYLLGRKPKEQVGIESLEKEAQDYNLSLLFLQPPKENSHLLESLSRKHLKFHLEKIEGDIHFVADSIVGKNKEIVAYYKGYNEVENGKRFVKPKEPIPVERSKKYPTTNLVILLPASEGNVLKLNFIGEGSEGTSIKISINQEDFEIYEAGINKLEQEDKPSVPFIKP